MSESVDVARSHAAAGDAPATARVGPVLRLLVALPSLEGGGAQRVLLQLVDRLQVLGGLSIGLVVASSGGALADQVPKNVELFDIGAASVRRAAPGFVRAVWAFRPDVVLSSVYHMNHLVLAVRPLLPAATRIVVREAIMPGAALPSRSHPGLRRALYRWLYPTADRIVVQCAAMAEELTRLFGTPPELMTRIWNPAPPPSVGDAPHVFPGSGPHVVAAGRVVPQKGFDRLVEAFPLLLEREPGAQLWILGDASGSHAGEVRNVAARLGIAERVHLVGFQADPRAWFAAADLFVLSSRFEGLPNVLIEALQVGCPVVALDGPGGARELLTTAGVPDRLVSRLSWEPEWFRGRGAASAPVADLSAFAPEHIVAEYLRVLREVSGRIDHPRDEARSDGAQREGSERANATR